MATPNTPHKINATAAVGILLLLKFLLFNILWCLETTFTPFSHLELWLSSFFVTGLLLAPLFFFRMWKTEAVIFFLLDILFIANLAYFNTYFNAIPLTSYALAGNLSDFGDSVTSSMRAIYLILPLTSIAALWILIKNRKRLGHPDAYGRRCYLDVEAMLFFSILLLQIPHGGFRQRIKDMRRNAYQYGNVVPNFTVFGSLLYDITTINPKMTPAEKSSIDSFIAATPPVPDINAAPRKNVVFILVESLESWPLETVVEGHEITPNLNRLLTDSTTLYAPHVLTQVRSGRSIDGQLIYFTGLLPMLAGVYSTEHPDNTYPSLQKAMRQFHGTTAWLVTSDKIQTWNQEGAAKAFGVEKMLSRGDFRMEEASGKHKRMGDRALMRQLVEKMKSGEVWPKGENVFLQVVTFTSHTPFKIDDSLKGVRFTGDIPELMNDYMTSVHYTDEAIGILLDYLKSRPDYKDTMIVIVGDHEGLANGRGELVASRAGKGVVSPWQLTPFIVVNSPVGGKYMPVMGQVDIYPTMLSLLNLGSYDWHGLGRSIFDPERRPVAVGSRMDIMKGTPEWRASAPASGTQTWFAPMPSGFVTYDFVEAETESRNQLRRAQDAHETSDLILQYNYFGQKTDIKR